MTQISRRNVLLSAAAATFAAVSWKLYSDQQESFLAEDLAEILKAYGPYAISVGEGYLRCTPHEADPKILAPLLLGERSDLWDEPAALRVYIRDKIRKDFSEGLTTEVNGWILSLTESRLCGLTAMLVHKNGI